MADCLNIDQDAVVGKLFRWWVWANMQSEDGHDLCVTEKFIDRLVYCEGFGAALKKVGWLAGNDGKMEIPNFERHNGQSAKTRALAAERKRKSRARQEKNVTKTGQGERKSHKISVTREEKSREEQNTPKAPKGATVVNNKKVVSIDPLHERIVCCFTPQFRRNLKRDAAELRAWAKVKNIVTVGDVEAIEQFYRLPKSLEFDLTWRRKGGVTQLMNQWVEQVDLAREMARAKVENDRPFKAFEAQFGKGAS